MLENCGNIINLMDENENFTKHIWFTKEMICIYCLLVK